MEAGNSEDLEEYEVIENLVNELRAYVDNKNSEGVEGLHKFIKDNIPPKLTKDVLREASMLLITRIFHWILLSAYLSIIQKVLVIAIVTRLEILNVTHIISIHYMSLAKTNIVQVISSTF